MRGPTATDYIEFAQTGPGTLAGRYLRHFGHPVYRADDLPPGRAKPIRVLGAAFTLPRSEDGVPHVIAPRCTHPGTQLSTGWIDGDWSRLAQPATEPRAAGGTC
jgi:5,5'-dehydrodivanillate O-demethylase oxygenase subunit